MQKELECTGGIKKSIKTFDYWIIILISIPNVDYLNYPKQMQPNFAADHTASLVMKRLYELEHRFNFTYTYATGDHTIYW